MSLSSSSLLARLLAVSTVLAACGGETTDGTGEPGGGSGEGGAAGSGGGVGGTAGNGGAGASGSSGQAGAGQGGGGQAGAGPLVPCFEKSTACEGLCVEVSSAAGCCSPYDGATCEGTEKVREKYGCELETSGWFPGNEGDKCCYRSCIAGRPLVVAQAVRQAGLADRGDWG